MKHAETHATIAYIVGRLISGKKIISLYDYSRSTHVEVDSLPDADSLKEFAYLQWSYLAPGARQSAKFRYSCGSGRYIDVAVKGSTFIGYAGESSSHFMGTVRGNSVHLFDQKSASHMTFRLHGPAVDID